MRERRHLRLGGVAAFLEELGCDGFLGWQIRTTLLPHIKTIYCFFCVLHADWNGVTYESPFPLLCQSLCLFVLAWSLKKILEPFSEPSLAGKQKANEEAVHGCWPLLVVRKSPRLVPSKACHPKLRALNSKIAGKILSILMWASRIDYGFNL